VSAPGEPSRGRWLLVAAVFAALAALVAWAALEMPGALRDQDRQINLVYYVLWLVVLLPSLLLARRYSARTMLRDAAGWLAILAVIAVAYSFRGEMQRVWERVAAEVLPHRGTVTDERAIAFRAAQDGHFHVEALVDGVRVQFLVDTGASDVVLNESDARRLGFDIANLSFHRVYRTANGQILGAPVTLGEVRIGPIALPQVRASVNRGEMGRSLLGMSFLGRLGGYGVADGTLTLRQ